MNSKLYCLTIKMNETINNWEKLKFISVWFPFCKCVLKKVRFLPSRLVVWSFYSTTETLTTLFNANNNSWWFQFWNWIFSCFSYCSKTWKHYLIVGALSVLFVIKEGINSRQHEVGVCQRCQRLKCCSLNPEAKTRLKLLKQFL